jgi:hypothetical protein
MRPAIRETFLRALALSVCLSALAPATALAGRTLVICAPGYPASTQQAQETMDAFAATLAASAGWKESDLSAVFIAEEQTGLDRLSRDDTPVALVPLEFYLRHEKSLGLRPLLQAVQVHGAEEVWSLVAKRGSILSPSSLSAWQITGRPGYAPAFVRGPILGGWGELPADAEIAFTTRPLSALRKAAAGEPIAVLLDKEQAASLDSLPFGAELEVVARSRPLPGVVLALVGDRLVADRVKELRKGLLDLRESKGGAELMKTMRLTRFQELDEELLEQVRLDYAGR